jgi:hypothetical protein
LKSSEPGTTPVELLDARAELARVPELLLDVLVERLDDLLRPDAVRVDRVGDVADHCLDFHPIRAGEHLDELLAVVLHIVVEYSHAATG